LLQLFCGFARIAKYFCKGVSDEVSGEFFGEFSIDVSDDTLFCYALSGDVSGKSSVI
jgi:hypothetical protein